MEIKDGKIVKATEDELFSHYLLRDLDDIMSFDEYLIRCEDLGTVIIYRNRRKQNET